MSQPSPLNEEAARSYALATRLQEVLASSGEPLGIQLHALAYHMGWILAAAAGANFAHMMRLLKVLRGTIETHARTSYTENAKDREEARRGQAS